MRQHQKYFYIVFYNLFNMTDDQSEILDYYVHSDIITNRTILTL